MNDKIVTHEDLDAARALAEAANRHGTEASRELARSILAAAEADQPPLPEGWVLLRYKDGSHGVFYYSGRGDALTRYDNGTGGIIWVEDMRDRLTPLRPTVTEADIEKAAMALYGVDDIENGWPEWAVEAAKTTGRKKARDILAAAGIEVGN